MSSIRARVWLWSMIDPDRISYIGHRDIWGGARLFGVSQSDRRQHLFLIGKSGVGKSTLLRNLILGDIAAGEGVALIDPHGDLAEEILDFLPPHRSRDVIYFDPSDLEFPFAFNVLQNDGADSIHLLASSIIGAFRSLWSSSWGPRLEHFFYNAVAALAECRNTSILGVPRMLLDGRYREWVVNHVRDPAIRAFWEVEFAGYDRRFVAEASAPILNKVGQFVASPVTRNILGQIRRAVNLRKVMDDRRIFIANLAKGKIGEDKSKLLGALLVAQFQQAAMSRANVPESKRADFFLYIDEFASFTSDSFATILAENRKYHCSMTLSGQHLSQATPEIRDAIIGNVGNFIAFRLGEADAQVMHREFGNGFHPAHFTDLANHHVLVKTLEQGRHPEPFHGVTLPPRGRFRDRREALIQQSRNRYATPRAIVEDRMRRWMDIDLLTKPRR
jgi:hypothetical protein